MYIIFQVHVHSFSREFNQVKKLSIKEFSLVKSHPVGKIKV